MRTSSTYKPIVLEVTGWRKHHPGGGTVFERRAGCDCTKEFLELGHTANAIQIAKKFVVGRLVSAETEMDGNAF